MSKKITKTVSYVIAPLVVATATAGIVSSASFSRKNGLNLAQKQSSQNDLINSPALGGANDGGDQTQVDSSTYRKEMFLLENEQKRLQSFIPKYTKVASSFVANDSILTQSILDDLGLQDFKLNDHFNYKITSELSVENQTFNYVNVSIDIESKLFPKLVQKNQAVFKIPSSIDSLQKILVDLEQIRIDQIIKSVTLNSRVDNKPVDTTRKSLTKEIIDYFDLRYVDFKISDFNYLYQEKDNQNGTSSISIIVSSKSNTNILGEPKNKITFSTKNSNQLDDIIKEVDREQARINNLTFSICKNLSSYQYNENSAYFAPINNASINVYNLSGFNFNFDKFNYYFYGENSNNASGERSISIVVFSKSFPKIGNLRPLDFKLYQSEKLANEIKRISQFYPTSWTADNGDETSLNRDLDQTSIEWFHLDGLVKNDNDFTYTFDHVPYSEGGIKYYKTTIYVALKELPNTKQSTNFLMPLSNDGFKNCQKVMAEKEAKRLSNFKPMTWHDDEGTSIKVIEDFSQSDADWFKLGELNLDREKFFYAFTQEPITINNLKYFNVTIQLLSKLAPDFVVTATSFKMPLSENAWKQFEIANGEVKRLSAFSPTKWHDDEGSTEIENSDFAQSDADWFGLGDLHLDPEKFSYKYSQKPLEINGLKYYDISIIASQKSAPEIEATTSFKMPLSESSWKTLKATVDESSRIGNFRPTNFAVDETKTNLENIIFDQKSINWMNILDLDLKIDEFNYTYNLKPVTIDNQKYYDVTIFTESKSFPGIKSASKTFRMALSYTGFEKLFDENAAVILESQKLEKYVPSNFKLDNGETTAIGRTLDQDSIDWFNLSGLEMKDLDTNKFVYTYDHIPVTFEGEKYYDVIIHVSSKQFPEFKQSHRFRIALSKNAWDKQMITEQNLVNNETGRLGVLKPTSWHNFDDNQYTNVVLHQGTMEYFGLQDIQLDEQNFNYTYDLVPKIENGLKYYEITINVFSKKIPSLSHAVRTFELAQSQETFTSMQEIEKETQRLSNFKPTTWHDDEGVSFRNNVVFGQNMADWFKLGGLNLDTQKFIYTFDQKPFQVYLQNYFEVIINVALKSSPNLKMSTSFKIALSQTAWEQQQNQSSLVSKEASRISQIKATSWFNDGVIRNYSGWNFDQKTMDFFHLSSIALDKNNFNYKYDIQTIVNNDQSYYLITIWTISRIDSSIKQSSIVKLPWSQKDWWSLKVSDEAKRLSDFSPSYWHDDDGLLSQENVDFSQSDAYWFNLGELNLDNDNFKYTFDQTPVEINGLKYYKIALNIYSKVEISVKKTITFMMSLSEEGFARMPYVNVLMALENKVEHDNSSNLQNEQDKLDEEQWRINNMLRLSKFNYSLVSDQLLDEAQAQKLNIDFLNFDKFDYYIKTTLTSDGFAKVSILAKSKVFNWIISKNSPQSFEFLIDGNSKLDQAKVNFEQIRINSYNSLAPISQNLQDNEQGIFDVEKMYLFKMDNFVLDENNFIYRYSVKKVGENQFLITISVFDKNDQSIKSTNSHSFMIWNTIKDFAISQDENINSLLNAKITDVLKITDRSEALQNLLTKINERFFALKNLDFDFNKNVYDFLTKNNISIAEIKQLLDNGNLVDAYRIINSFNLDVKSFVVSDENLYTNIMKESFELNQLFNTFKLYGFLFHNSNFDNSFAKIFLQYQKDYSQVMKRQSSILSLKEKMKTILTSSQSTILNMLDNFTDKKMNDSFIVSGKDKVYQNPMIGADAFARGDYIGQLNDWIKANINIRNSDDQKLYNNFLKSMPIYKRIIDKDNYWFVNKLQSGNHNNQLLNAIYQNIHFTDLGDKLGYGVTVYPYVNENITVELDTQLSPKNYGYTLPQNINGEFNSKNSFAYFIVRAHNGFKFEVSDENGKTKYVDAVRVMKIVEKSENPISTRKMQNFVYGENLIKLYESIRKDGLGYYVDKQPFDNAEVNVIEKIDGNKSTRYISIKSNSSTINVLLNEEWVGKVNRNYNYDNRDFAKIMLSTYFDIPPFGSKDPNKLDFKFDTYVDFDSDEGKAILAKDSNTKTLFISDVSVFKDFVSRTLTCLKNMLNFNHNLHDRFYSYQNYSFVIDWANILLGLMPLAEVVPEIIEFGNAAILSSAISSSVIEEVDSAAITETSALMKSTIQEVLSSDVRVSILEYWEDGINDAKLTSPNMITDGATAGSESSSSSVQSISIVEDSNSIDELVQNVEKIYPSSETEPVSSSVTADNLVQTIDKIQSTSSSEENLATRLSSVVADTNHTPQSTFELAKNFLSLSNAQKNAIEMFGTSPELVDIIKKFSQELSYDEIASEKGFALFSQEMQNFFAKVSIPALKGMWVNVDLINGSFASIRSFFENYSYELLKFVSKVAIDDKPLLYFEIRSIFSETIDKWETTANEIVKMENVGASSLGDFKNIFGEVLKNNADVLEKMGKAIASNDLEALNAMKRNVEAIFSKDLSSGEDEASMFDEEEIKQERAAFFEKFPNIVNDFSKENSGLLSESVVQNIVKESSSVVDDAFANDIRYEMYSLESLFTENPSMTIQELVNAFKTNLKQLLSDYSHLVSATTSDEEEFVDEISEVLEKHLSRSDVNFQNLTSGKISPSQYWKYVSDLAFDNTKEYIADFFINNDATWFA